LVAAVLLLSLLGVIPETPLWASVTVTLSSTTTPAAGEPGISRITLTGQGFPAGVIPEQNVVVTLTPSASGGASTAITATDVDRITDGVRRITFGIPGSIVVTAPTSYEVSISGTTLAGISFSSTNTAALTINPQPTIASVNPSSGRPTQSISVVVTGLATNFVAGKTRASVGPGISVGGAPEGTPGPVTVNSPISFTAEIFVGPSDAPGPREVSVMTPPEHESLAQGFVVITQRTATTGTNGIASFPNEGLVIRVTDIASKQPLANMKVTVLNDGSNQGLFAADPTGYYAPNVGLVPACSGLEIQTQEAVDPQISVTTVLSLGVDGPLGFGPIVSPLPGDMFQYLINQCEAACAGGTASCQKSVPLSALRADVLNAIVPGAAGEAFLDALGKTATFAGATKIVGGAFAITGASSSALSSLESIEGIYYQQEGYQWSSLFNACEEVPAALNPIPGLVGVGSLLVMYPLGPPPGTIVSTTVSGAVLDAATGAGIAGATVYAVPGGFSVTTASGGTYSGSVQGSPGEYVVAAEAAGYVTASEQFSLEQNGQPVSIALSLAPYSLTQPVILSVTPVAAQATQGIVISGSGFGNTPPQTVALGDGSVDTVACNVTTPGLTVWDNAPGGVWQAGQESCTTQNVIGIKIGSWSDTQIVLNGFGSALSSSPNPTSYNIAAGNPLTFTVSGPNNSGTATYNLQVLPATPAAPAGAVSVNVPGNQGWTDTGVSLSAGDTVTISASGLVTLTTDGHIPPMSPAGFPPNCTAAEVYGQFFVPFPAVQLPCWSLIGQIGTVGPIFEVGANTVFQAQTSGELFLGVNDNNLGDNSGSWNAVVTVAH